MVEEQAAREGWNSTRTAIARAYQPRHDAIGMRMVKAVELLGAVITEETALLAEIEAAGGALATLSQRWLSLGIVSPDNWASPIAAWLRAHKDA